MTTLTQEDVAEFQRICEEEDGVTITVDEAREAARRVAFIYELLLRPTPKEQRAGRLREICITHADTIKGLKRGSRR